LILPSGLVQRAIGDPAIQDIENSLGLGSDGFFGNGFECLLRDARNRELFHQADRTISIFQTSLDDDLRIIGKLKDGARQFYYRPTGREYHRLFDGNSPILSR